ncbi:MAG: hypothetical protein ABIR11_08050 [Candidatus Limnocylindrales bacterium]
MGGDMQALRDTPPPDPGVRRGGGSRAALPAVALLLGIIALPAIIILTQRGQLTTPPATSAGSADLAGVEALYDRDGIPRTIGSEPVLRGAAIGHRAAIGDPAPFVVAGWRTNDPTSSCAPSPVHCDYTSLVDAPGSRATGVVTLERPAGTEFSFDGGRQWAGGFFLLRVRAGCSFGRSVCLVVDEEIEPAGALPTGPDGFGADGLPLTVDGQPVVRGPAVVSRLQTDGDTLPVWVAGRVASAPPVDRICPDLVTWDPHPCPATELADPDLGLPFGAGAATLQVDHWGLQAAWEPGVTWPGGYVVLRATSSIVLGSALPPTVMPQPTPDPVPSISVGSSAWHGRIVVEIDGRRVRSGSQIGSYVATAPGATFLVTGVVRQQACGTCTSGTASVLVEATAKGAIDHGTAYPLLRSDGSAFTAGTLMIWTDPAGIVVLEVRRFAGVCPVGVSCADALEVLGVTVPSP